MKSIAFQVACLFVLVVSVQSQWLNNFGYGMNPAGYFGGYYPTNGIHTGYTGFPSAAFYGHPGQFVNYPAASLPSYDAFGNQVGGYGQVQDTPEVAQAKAAHFAAHAAARAHLTAPVPAVLVAPVADVAATPVVETVAAATPVETAAVAAAPISRKKRQIQPLTPVNSSPFAYSFASPLAYNHYAGSPFAYSNFGTPFGYNYGAPFGYHFANPYPYNGQYFPTAVAATPVAPTNTVASTNTDTATATTTA